MAVQSARLDDGLMRALQEGSAALPRDLNRLRDYLGMVQGLLAEKANDFEPSWEMAEASLAETETLLVLEEMILERAAHVPGRNLWDAVGKLAIWEEITGKASNGEGGQNFGDRLVQSARHDLERIASSGAGPFIQAGLC